MGLVATFQNAAKTAFNAFGDIVKDATYIDITDDGFTKTETNYDCTVVPVSDWQQDQKLSKLFEGVVQPNDVLALVPGIDLSVNIKNGSKMSYTPEGHSTAKTFTVVDKKVDPARALFVLLLRKL